MGLVVVPKEAVREVIGTDFEAVESHVATAYVNHFNGNTVLPHSLFLRPQAPEGSRIIALPAYSSGADGDAAVGVKWVSSYPSNLKLGKDRASAIIILNDQETGEPKAVVEASLINAARTAASAVLFARCAQEQLGKSFKSVGIVGTGVIGDRTLRHLFATMPPFKTLRVHDLAPERAHAFGQHLAGATGAHIGFATLEETVQESDLVIFTTTSATPYVDDPELFKHGPTVLHISLRDLGPTIIRSALNYADDTDHAIREATSLALARDEDATLAVHEIGEALTTGMRDPEGKPLIFSPFGLGVLDLAVASLVLEASGLSALTSDIDFF